MSKNGQTAAQLNSCTDVQNRLWDSVGEGEDGMF